MSLDKKKINKFPLVAVLFFLLTINSCKDTTGIGPGDIAKNFSLPLINGEMRDLTHYRGKVVIINFWASWCVPCLEEMPSLERLYQKFKDSGLVVLGIGIDDTAQALEEFQKKLGITFPILVDSKGTLKLPYSIRGYPETFIVDRKGKIVLFMDPDTNQPVTKVIGPRDWDSPEVMGRIKKLL